MPIRPWNGKPPGPYDGLADTSAADAALRWPYDIDSAQDVRVAGRFHVSTESPIFAGPGNQSCHGSVFPGDVDCPVRHKGRSQ